MNSPDPGAAKLVIFIHSGYSVDVELAKYFANMFRKHGFELQEINLTDPEMSATFAALISTGLSRIFCFLSLNYYAAQLRINNQPLHQATGIPLVFFLADHPLYFVDSHGPEFEGTIVYVPGRDLVDFVAKYYPAGTIVVNGQTFLPPPFPHEPPSIDNFLARQNKILCPINLSIWGRSMDGVWELIKALPPPRRAIVIRLIEALLTDCVTPLHVLFEALPERGGPEERQIRDARLALDFVKVWRRNHMVRTLIDLPILVSSEYVPADLQLKYPEKFTLLSIDRTLPLYHEYRFVLNSFPLMTYAFHERAIKALYANALLITDPNNRMRECLTDDRDVLFYHYTEDDGSRIAEVMDDPARAYQRTVHAHDTLLRHPAFHYDSYIDLIAAVDRRRNAIPEPADGNVRR